MPHGFPSAVALNLQAPDFGSRSLALQIIGLAKLLVSRLGFLERFAMLLSVNARADFVFQHLELGGLLGVFGLFEFGLILGARRVGVRPLLRDLVLEVPEFRLLIEERLDLVLPIKFYQQVILLDSCPDRGQFGEDQRTELLAGDPRSKHRTSFDSLSRSGQAEQAHKIAALDDRRARGHLESRRGTCGF